MKQADMSAMPVDDIVVRDENGDLKGAPVSNIGLTKRQHAELELLKSLCINKRETQPMTHLVEDAQKLARLLIESWESENE